MGSRNVECRKFSPNIFNKSKCTHCFRQREEHSAAALECNRVQLLLSGVFLFKDKKPTILARKQFRNGQIFKDLVLAVVPVRAAENADGAVIMPGQKQTRAGQRTRYKTFVAIGDSNGHICLGVKYSKEVATAIRSAIILAKLSVVPVRRGY
ncbi:hypothetical protein quinque_008987 [Culex quinquefasciatus]